MYVLKKKINIEERLDIAVLFRLSRFFNSFKIIIQRISDKV